MTDPARSRTLRPGLLLPRLFTGVAVAAVLVLTSCAPALPEKNMQTPQESHDALRDAMASTIELLGGPDGWTEYSDNSPDQCSVNGVDGVIYDEDQIGPGVASLEERDATVSRVREHLESLGMTTWLAEKTEADPMVIVDAEGGPTRDFSVYVSTEQLVVTGRSWCVPGDWEKLVLEHAE